MSVIIRAHELSKRFLVPKKEPGISGAFQGILRRTTTPVDAVKGVTFQIEEGELVGFIGPNGAGKTTTLKMLSGLMHQTSGTVDVMGHVPAMRDHRFLSQIALVMGQKNQLWWDLPAVDSFLLYKEIYGVNDRDYRTSIDELVSLFDVSGLLSTPVRRLSLGERMKMELIAALIHHPRVLFLDEPTIGLDVMMQSALREFIREYNRKFHTTIMLTSHYMADVEQLCKRVMMIDHGTLMFDGSLADLSKKHTKMKRIRVTLEKRIPQKELSQYGTIVAGSFPQVTYEVEREGVTALVTILLSKLPVADIDITEPDIEDVIRSVFRTNSEQANDLL